VDGVAKVDDPLPDGEYYCLTAFVRKGSDFTLDEAVARLRAALPGRVVRCFPARRDARALAPWGGDRIVGFFIGVASSEAGGRAAVLRACDVLSGFRGVEVHVLGQGEACCRVSSR
jgi:hypothetical protein